MPYLDDWEKCVKERTGFSSEEKRRMLLSSETILGLRMTGTKIMTSFAMQLINVLFSQLIHSSCQVRILTSGSERRLFGHISNHQRKSFRH